jgi:hypothetical protein
MTIPYLPATVKVKIIEYLCSSKGQTNLNLYVKDVYNWFLAEPGLYRDVLTVGYFYDNILGEAWLKYIFNVDYKYPRFQIVTE